MIPDAVLISDNTSQEIMKCTLVLQILCRDAIGGCDEHEIKVGVATGQFQQWFDVTEKVLNMVGSTEREMDCCHCMREGMKKSRSPSGCCQQNTDLLPHDDGIAQWITYSNIPVKCHDTEEKALTAAQEMEKV